MIGFLRGSVVQLSAEYCLLDVGGVGYRVFIPSSTRTRLKTGEESMLYTHLSVREDAL
ncbi:MAG: Holliday junction branch migration protein RuvA, partial [Schwartzia sp.]|nr:Holliday junction branch migration protein RuvA [Schwartzia sp. (in: firmicutes)]